MTVANNLPTAHSPDHALALRVGLDECGTQNLTLNGWSMFILTEQLAQEFSAEVDTMRKATGVHEFHAKKCKSHHAEAYKAFLSLVRHYSGRSLQCRTVISLSSAGWNAEKTGFAERIARNALVGSGVTDAQILNIAERLATALFLTVRESVGLGSRLAMRLEFDDDDQTRVLKQLSHKNASGSTVSAERLLATLVNAFRTSQNLNAPDVLPNGISVLRGSRSPVVQAADVLGNFAMCYLFKELGDDSRNRLLRAGIFEQVFGDLLDPFALQSQMKLQGHDIRLLSEGEIRFRISWEIA